jgi:hypothetical protein
MTHGLQIKNNANEILIDSDFAHYHYIGKATYSATTRIPDMLDGNNTQHSTTAGQYISSSQVNGDIIKYTIATNSASSPPPMCFIKPSSTGSSAPHCGIVLTKRSGSSWEIWVLQTRGGTYSSPTSYTRPDLYCFSPLTYMTSSQASVGSSTYGLATFNSSGGKTFDSRLKPLKIIGVRNVSAPTIARTGSKSNSWDPIFTPDQSTDFDMTRSNSETGASDLIFYAPSLAHSCQEHQADTDGDGFQSQGYNSFFFSWARTDLWWCFYRNVFRLSHVNASTTRINSSYGIYASGHVWKSVQDNSSLLAAIVAAAAAFLTFGASLVVVAALVAGTALTAAFASSGTASGTYLPYQNGGRNQSEIVTVLMSKASYYD